MKKLRNTLVLSGAVLLGACANSGDRDLGYALQETAGAPVSFLVGAARQAEKNPGKAVYDLTGRAVSEAGRVINGVTHMATGNRYDAEFGSAKIHPMADNNTVKLTGWGAVGGYFSGKTLLGILSGFATGLGLDTYNESQRKK
tara:strand:+ start:4769 stop:5197 length:429 start_codon:yes stop_codon:yes gene_type:complete